MKVTIEIDIGPLTDTAAKVATVLYELAQKLDLRIGHGPMGAQVGMHAFAANGTKVGHLAVVDGSIARAGSDIPYDHDAACLTLANAITDLRVLSGEEPSGLSRTTVGLHAVCMLRSLALQIEAGLDMSNANFPNTEECFAAICPTIH